MPNKVPLKQAKKPPLAPTVDMKPPGPYLNKWNTLDADRLYATGNKEAREVKEEKTYSQAFAKKLLNSSNKSTHKPGVQPKKEREKGAFLGSSAGHGSVEEPDSAVSPFSISLEGHGLDHGEGSSSREPQQQPQQKKRAKKSESYGKNRTTMNSSLFGGQEGGPVRPTIERGGTNTISMEVSGVGSRSSTNEGPTMLSQTTKDSFIHKKQKYQSEEGGVEQSKKLRSPTHSNSARKPPLPTEATESSVSSAPAEAGHRRSKHRKHHSGGRKFQNVVSPQDFQGTKTLSSGKTPLNITDMDSPGGGSPMELDNALLESQVHTNPDLAIKTALQSLSSEDWSSKCEGLGMLMCLVRSYPHILQPHMHSVHLALIKEVGSREEDIYFVTVYCVSGEEPSIQCSQKGY